MHTPSFDHRLSLQLDKLITQLEERPAIIRRAWLRVQKRVTEYRVPAYGKQVTQ